MGVKVTGKRVSLLSEIKNFDNISTTSYILISYNDGLGKAGNAKISYSDLIDSQLGDYLSRDEHGKITIDKSILDEFISAKNIKDENFSYVDDKTQSNINAYLMQRTTGGVELEDNLIYYYIDTPQGKLKMGRPIDQAQLTGMISYASIQKLGLIQTGYLNSGNSHAVNIDSNGNAYVNVNRIGTYEGYLDGDTKILGKNDIIVKPKDNDITIDADITYISTEDLKTILK